MKILVIAKWMVRWNGASRVAYELSKRFKEEHEVRIVAYKDFIDSEWEKEFEVYKLQHKGLLAIKEIRDVINDYKPDIIHSHDWLGLLALNSGVPQVTTCHSSWPMNWFISSRNFLVGIIQEIPNKVKMHMVDGVIAVSKYQQKILNNLGIKSEVIHNGVDYEFFESLETCVELKHPSILFVGRVDDNKAKYLVSFINKLNRKKINVQIYIIGIPANKKIVDELEKLENTHYLGVFDDVRPYYHEADVLMFISRIEAFPLVPIEAQACGLPVVAFNVCSNSELIKNNENGLLITSNDVNEIAEKVLILLKNNRLRKKMSRKAVKVINRNFLWNDKSKNYLKVLKSLSKGR